METQCVYSTRSFRREDQSQNHAAPTAAAAPFNPVSNRSKCRYHKFPLDFGCLLNMITVSHPNGSRNARILARYLSETELIDTLFVSLDTSILNHISDNFPSSIATQLRRRRFTEAPGRVVATQPLLEIAMLFCERVLSLGDVPFVNDYRSREFIVLHDEKVARRMNKRGHNAQIIYAYTRGALNTFNAAAKLGIKSVLEYTEQHHLSAEGIYAEERELNPEWAALLPTLIADKHWSQRADHELESADMIVAPSHYVARALPSHVQTKAVVVPYGVQSALRFSKIPSDGALRILFVGSLTQRKGISYLFDALKKVGSIATLTVIGSRPSVQCAPLNDAMANVNWISTLSNNEILREMAQHDILVLPSLSEAYGLVVAEALSQATPVIVTPNVGSSELVVHGYNGFVVPIRDSNAIADAFIDLHKNRSRLDKMSKCALDTAASFPEERFGMKVVSEMRRMSIMS